MASELKFFDTTRSALALSTTGTLVDDSLNHVPQDATESGRLGRKITVTGISLRGSYNFGSTSTLSNMDQRVRLLVFVDTQCNGAAAPVESIINTGGVTNVNSFRDLPNYDRFEVLYDRWFNIHVNAVLQDGAGTGDSVPMFRGLEIHIPCEIPIEFDDSAADGSITTIRTNNIGVMGVCAAANLAPTITYVSRINYFDN